MKLIEGTVPDFPGKRNEPQSVPAGAASKTNEIERGGEQSPLPAQPSCPVVGIGASAGGLEAFSKLLNNLPANTGMGYVLVQHLDPHHESMLADLLGSQSSMPVQQALQGIKVQPNNVYIIPPNTQMAIRQGVLELTPRAESRVHNLPVDFFFSSLAEDKGSRAIGVILSGAASDGTLGMEAIKAAGGITFAQDDSAKFDGMPRSAVASGVIDFVLPPEQIAHELTEIMNHSYFGERDMAAQAKDGPAVEKILTLLHNRTGVNFAHYKKPTTSRRLARRMALHHIEESEEYLQFLEHHPAELDALLDDMLITVTEFFRDPSTFETLTEKGFPAILKDRRPEDTIRVWVPGCSTGKEVYSLAILLIEYLERTNQSFPIQIFGTDISERSIEKARYGKYPESISATVSPDRLKRFFVKIEDGYQIARFVRDFCIFSRQDLTKDPPLSKMDLISCRNLLIYLGAILQRRVLSIFIYSLQPTGCLLLGNSESLGSLVDHFLVLDAKHKIYRRNLELARPQFELPSRIYLPETAASQLAPLKVIEGASDTQIDRLLIEQYAPSGFLINEQNHVKKFRGDVGPYLSPPPGSPELDIFKLLREDLGGLLRSVMEESRQTGVVARRDGIQIRRNDGFREINLVVRPIGDSLEERDSLVLFEELSQHRYGVQAVASSLTGDGTQTQDYDNVVLELSATRTYMQRLVEELRSANEEAQSSNEELQSTNEELQTAKEELQSANEELTTTNEEMQSRNRELGLLNNDLLNLLSSMQIPVVMLDSGLRIRRFTPVAERVLNLIPTDIGRPISDLKPRINAPDLDDLLHQTISSMSPLDREVQDQSGHWYSMRIHPYKTSEGRVEGAVLQFVDIDQLKLAMDEVRHARDYAEGINATVRESLLVLDDKLCIQSANRAFFDTFEMNPEATRNQSIYELDAGQWDHPKVRGLLDSLLQDGNMVVHDVELEHEFRRIGWKTFQMNARYVHRDRTSGLILLAIEDVSDRKKAAEAKYRRLFETAKDGIVIINADSGEITDVNPYLTELIGVSRVDLIGKPFWEADGLQQLKDGPSVLERLNAENVLRFPDISLNNNSDGEPLEVEIVANIYEEGQKRVAQFNVRDITERKQFDQQFQQTARLESLGILAGGIAHDFNNLLAGILGNAGLALGEAPPGTSYHSALRDVIHASQKAAELTRQMLAYAGKGRLDVRPLNLSTLVKEISKLVQSSIPKSVDLKLNLDEGINSVEADAGQMQQVTMNLIINGAEAVGENQKGEVRVSTRVEQLSAEDLRLKYGTAEAKPGSFVILEVIDNGCGMDESTRARVYDPFFTTKFTGRGLGLAAVQGIIRAHHGAIHVSSAVGKGTTFQVLLPSVPHQAAEVITISKPQDLRGTGTILVIDDEEIVLKTSKAILEQHGYQVLTATNGELGLEIVREHKSSIDLIILDLTMPVMGGEEALRHIRAIAPELPVVLSSGYDSAQAMSRFGEDALAGFIHKPSTVTNFLEKVKDALRIKSERL